MYHLHHIVFDLLAILDAIEQRLHGPHQAHRLGAAPVGRRLVEHLAIEGHLIAAPGRVVGELQRHIDGGLRAGLVERAH